MQTMRRYYSNTLSDAEKQNTMNIFLGIFRPNPNQAPIWERDNNSDYYLHHQVVKVNISKPLTQWWDKNLINHLPLPRELAEKSCTQLVYNQNNLELLEDYYRPFELTVLQVYTYLWFFLGRSIDGCFEATFLVKFAAHLIKAFLLHKAFV